jgi:hypothetical protein
VRALSENNDSASAAAGTALAQLPPDATHGDNVQLQKLWLATQRREWRSLAVLATSPSVDTMELAELLAKLAWWYRGQPSCIFDFRDLSMRLVDYHQRDVKAQVETGVCVFIALRSTVENPAAIPIARSADAAVLGIELGKSDMKIAERTISEIGRERVLGAIVVRPHGIKRSFNGG